MIIGEKLLAELAEQRDYLIQELGVTYEDAELMKLSGRLYELNKVIDKLIEMAGE